jgi:hypothetical protein
MTHLSKILDAYDVYINVKPIRAIIWLIDVLILD